MPLTKSRVAVMFISQTGVLGLLAGALILGVANYRAHTKVEREPPRTCAVETADCTVANMKLLEKNHDNTP